MQQIVWFIFGSKHPANTDPAVEVDREAFTVSVKWNSVEGIQAKLQLWDDLFFQLQSERPSKRDVILYSETRSVVIYKAFIVYGMLI